MPALSANLTTEVNTLEEWHGRALLKSGGPMPASLASSSNAFAPMSDLRRNRLHRPPVSRVRTISFWNAV